MSKLKFSFAILIMALISPDTFAQEEPSTYDVPMSDSDSESGEAPIELPEGCPEGSGTSPKYISC